MGLQQQGGAWENWHQRSKQRTCPLPLPLAPRPLPLAPWAPWAPCPAPPPEATHNKADLNNKDIASNQRAGQGRVRAAVGLAGKNEKRNITEEKKKTTKKKGKTPVLPPCLPLPHTSPRSYPRPSLL